MSDWGGFKWAEMIATISRELGREIATPTEARTMMGIRPA
jgi:hypothetical protein